MSDHPDMPEPTGADADTPLEPWLQALADDYHRPPPVPREAMWGRIQAARAVATETGDAAADDGRAGVPIIVGAAGTLGAAELAAGDDLARRRAELGGGNASRANAGRANAGGGNAGGRGLAAWAGPSLGLAAALLLAAGLGWWTRTERPATVGLPTAGATIARIPADSTPPTAVEQPTAQQGLATATVQQGLATATAAAIDGRPAGVDVDAAGRGATGRRSPSPAARVAASLVADHDTRPGSDDGGVARGADAAGAPYRLAAAQYLGQAEALLTVFRAESTRDAADPSLQSWARELLTTTRLLLDSPAARDPRLGALLGELEPVLVQIVQLPAARAAEERQLIARSIERSDLMTQLRSVVPAGPDVPQRAGE